MSTIKVFIVEERSIRTILLVSKYNDELATRLQRFTNEFVNKYQNQLKDWSGETLTFKSVEELIERYFGSFQEN
ncbi:MAG: hypothetical protein HeimC3_34020 [Candidatus Heimdallarchaeota archaeon LC_3]|nr:MAG: hypothetical protein HeimC3_34020 [Candidatus Heimdallarchaeota archaeon LC_3]